MGILRLWLASVVLLGHAPAIPGVGRYFHAMIAVQIFFAISGFFMQFILPPNDPSWRQTLNFYGSRAMRIYPLFFIALAVTTPLVLFFLPDRSHYINLTTTDNVFVTGTPGAIFATLVTNLTMFGQDVLRFLAYDPATGAFSFKTNLQGLPTYAVGSSMQVISQSWSIALELYFYLLVPFILPRSTAVILGLAALSVMARIVTFAFGFDSVNFVYAAFPFELATFLAGALACRVYLSYRKQLEGNLGGVAAWLGAVAMLAYGYWYASLPGNDYNSLKHWAFLIFAIAMLPFFFAYTRRSKLDRFLGELSYPIYIVHIPVIVAFAILGMRMDWRGLAAVATTLFLSVLAMKFIQAPVDRMRHRWFDAGQEPVATLHLGPSARTPGERRAAILLPN